MQLRQRPFAALALAALAAALTGCGSSSTPSIPVSAQLIGASSTSPGRIILSQLGAQRIGVQTAAVQAVPTPAPRITTRIVAGVKHTTSTPAPKPSDTAIVPYSAVIYEPSGKTYAFTNTAPMTYTEVPITVDRIDGNSAYLTVGPKPGAKVVSVGAEELFGVQTGVLAQT